MFFNNPLLSINAGCVKRLLPCQNQIDSQNQSAQACLNGEPAMAVNEKNLENQKRRLRFRRLADYFFRFSCFFQSGLKHR